MSDIRLLCLSLYIYTFQHARSKTRWTGGRRSRDEAFLCGVGLVGVVSGGVVGESVMRDGANERFVCVGPNSGSHIM